MKLASLKPGRDGQLAVVSNDLTRAVGAGDIAPTMQAALDDWAKLGPELAELAAELETGGSPSFASGRPIAPRLCRAPINGSTVRPM